MRKLLHAEELARLAGVHKSTVLLAIRRGELKASRTAGRSARISPDEARSYLRKRNRPIPIELELEGGVQRVAVVTESHEVVGLVRAALPDGAELIGGTDLYGSLVAIGAGNPAAIVLDLDLVFMNPVILVRAFRNAPGLRKARIVGLGLRDELFAAARSAGADHAMVKVDQRGLADVLRRAVTEAYAMAS